MKNIQKSNWIRHDVAIGTRWINYDKFDWYIINDFPQLPSNHMVGFRTNNLVKL
jgi:hypothetical protein